MCIIIEKKAGHEICKAWHNEFWLNNSDGMGVVFWQAGKPCVFKATDKKAAHIFLQSLRDKPAIIHYRYATHGSKGLDMVHPFEIIKGVYLIHNGIVDAPQDTDKSQSDTARLARHVLRPLLNDSINPCEFIRSPAFRFLFESLLGSSNRAVICDAMGYVTYNDNLWHTLSEDENKAGTLAGARLSNTYAWDSPIEPPTKKGKASGSPSLAHWDRIPDDFADYATMPAWEPKGYDLESTLASLPYNDLLDWVTDNPFEAADLIEGFLK